MKSELNRLTSLPAGSLPPQFRVDTGCGQLECEIVDVNPLACSIQSLVYTTKQLADASPETLRKICDNLAYKLSYLLEPIRAVEFDANACTVQMRSNPPQRDGDGTSYYELLVSRGGHVQLCRYNKPKGSERRIIPATFTTEVFLRLAVDLTNW